MEIPDTDRLTTLIRGAQSDGPGCRGADPHRSPLVLPDDLLADWLDPKLTDHDTVREMIKSVPPPVLTPYPVSKAVNNVRNNRPDLLTPIAPV